jgi:hypothetical protein
LPHNHPARSVVCDVRGDVDEDGGAEGLDIGGNSKRGCRDANQRCENENPRLL